jgi:phage replication O-like protein O
MTRKPFSLTNATPVPNLVIDDLMPRLRDTEFRLLLVVLRQTWGWHKERDWLTHSQLKRRTGRSSAALSKAISVLVRANLILVRNRAGQILDTAVERRREQASLYFSLHPVLIVHLFRTQVREAHIANSQTTMDKRQLDKRKQQQVTATNDQPPIDLSPEAVGNGRSGAMSTKRIQKADWRQVGGSKNLQAVKAVRGRPSRHERKG